MKYLTSFSTELEYEDFLNSEEYSTYNVSLVGNSVKYTPEYLSFRATADSTISIKSNGTCTPNIEYSTDRENWSTYTLGTSISVASGNTIHFRGDNPTGFSTSSSNYCNFVMSGSFISYGDVMALLHNGYIEVLDNKTLPCNYCFYKLFEGCTSLMLPPNFSATTITADCYERAFYGCTYLKAAPNLPATSTKDNCYKQMFYNCNYLKIASDLKATNLAGACYNEMFYNCTRLEKAPNIEATGTAEAYSCSSMFNGCSGLITPPAKLNCTVIGTRAYGWMFYNCSKLTTAPLLPINITLLAGSNTSKAFLNMFAYCSKLQEAPMFGLLTLHNSGSDCEFYRTLYYCSSVKWISLLFTNDTSFKGALFISSVSLSDGTYVKNLLANWETNAYAIPGDCTNVIFYDIPNKKYYKTRTKVDSAYVGSDECDKYGNLITTEE